MNLDDFRALIDAALSKALPQKTAPPLIVEAMRYALLAGGKRLRPCLVLAAAEAVASRDRQDAGAAVQRAVPAACAIELIHTYSLVHDDLPAMDDDTLRRGRPTAHVVYGDGIAILAGDGLLTEAFALLAESPSRVASADDPEPSPDSRLRIIRILATAAGAAGMVGGQTIDLAAEGRVPAASRVRLDATSLKDLHARKTGALIRAAATMGATAADADAATTARVDEYAQQLGLAFQIVDDVLDVEGSDAELGKTAGKDAAAGKPTYPALYGLDASKTMARDCLGRAETALARVKLADSRLLSIGRWIVERSN